MILYWLMVGLPGLFGIIEQTHPRRQSRLNAVWLLTGILIALVIGLRWKTGGDWGNYYANLLAAMWQPFSASLNRDIGFAVLVYLAARLDFGIVYLTLASGIVMGTALVRFSLSQPRPWLCLAVAMPYLVIIVGMGYIRQAMAIAFFMIALTALGRGNVVRYIVWIVVGSLFHSTAIVLAVVPAMVQSRNRALTAALGVGVVVVGYFLLLAERTDVLMSGYIDSEMDSSGAAVRLLMTALPAVIYLVGTRHFELDAVYRSAWRVLAIFSLGLLVALALTPSSTVLDRLGLYLVPLQCFVYSRVPDAFGRNEQQRTAMAAGIVLLYIVVFFTFMSFGDHAKLWKPYRFFFFEDGLCIECGDPKDHSY